MMDVIRWFKNSEKSKTSHLTIAGIQADLERKPIKNLNIRVFHQTGQVRISAPMRMRLDVIESFALSKLGWILKQKNKASRSVSTLPKKYTDGELHLYLGTTYPLRVQEIKTRQRVMFIDGRLELGVRVNSTQKSRGLLLESWYRAKLKEILPGLIEKWQERMGVEVQEFRIKKMKTRWGTCNIRARRIWLNLDLIKESMECFEYVVVHEMAHLIEKGHGKRFIALMDQHIPDWRARRNQLNRLRNK